MQIIYLCQYHKFIDLSHEVFLARSTHPFLIKTVLFGALVSLHDPVVFARFVLRSPLLCLYTIIMQTLIVKLSNFRF